MGRFPDGFLWGASSSAYQIEGGNDRSTFTAWEKKRGWEPCGRAADSWNLWRDDIACLKILGANAYRFSVEWSRIEPSPGVFDRSALERYAEISRALKENGIRPIVCLHHFSEPAWLYKKRPQGWLDPQTPGDFVRFAEETIKALSGSVRDWISFNEPMVWSMSAYALGLLPPGFYGVLRLESMFLKPGGLLDRLLGAHSAVWRAVHESAPDAQIGLAQNIVELEPARDRPADRKAVEVWERFMHREILDRAASEKTLDFIGLNYYTRIFVAASWLPFFALGVVPAYAELEKLTGPLIARLLGARRGVLPRSGMDWEIAPEGLGKTALALSQDYSVPIFVTENGLADDSEFGREKFIKDHLSSLAGAIEKGANIRGYLHWSLIDNYEWSTFKHRFGLFKVDRQNGFKRTPASGAEYFSKVIAANAVV